MLTQPTHFCGSRYSTKQISDEVPLDLQIFLWGLVDKLASEVQADYLQVFSLSLANDEQLKQRVIHTQEVPPYEREHHFPTVSRRQGKIYAICDGTHATMLWASEY